MSSRITQEVEGEGEGVGLRIRMGMGMRWDEGAEGESGRADRVCTGEGIEEEEEEGVWLVGWWKGGQGRV